MIPRYVKILTVLEFIWKAISKLPQNIIGLVWWFVAFPFRKKARNIVYNYMYANGLSFPRMPKARKVGARWLFENNVGYIKYNKVTRLEFEIYRLLFWSWIDDDASLVGTAEFHAVDVYGSWSEKRSDDDVMLSDGSYTNIGANFVTKGSFFKIGELQNENTITDIFKFYKVSWLWNVRNTAYNFRYYTDGDKLGDYDVREVYMGSEDNKKTMTINTTDGCADMAKSIMGVEGSWLYNSKTGKCMFSYSKAIWVSWINRYMELRLGWKLNSKDIKHTCRFYKKCSS